MVLSLFLLKQQRKRYQPLEISSTDVLPNHSPVIMGEILLHFKFQENFRLLEKRKKKLLSKHSVKSVKKYFLNINSESPPKLKIQNLAATKNKLSTILFISLKQREFALFQFTVYLLGNCFYTNYFYRQHSLLGFLQYILRHWVDFLPVFLVVPKMPDNQHLRQNKRNYAIVKKKEKSLFSQLLRTKICSK